mmetsp:Transcript_28/g.57  ORF Transcript_28/g.57 Transcript_28/m.57 type:complete len:329 (-) Transcript_28:248-1234(-)
MTTRLNSSVVQEEDSHMTSKPHHYETRTTKKSMLTANCNNRRSNQRKMLRFVVVLIVMSQQVHAGISEGRYASNNDNDSTTTRNVLPLASCPTGDHVIGTYYNNGKKCVRDRVVKERQSQKVECPEGYKFHSGYCKKNGLSKRLKPNCPDGYERKGKYCYEPCPDGFIPSKNTPSSEKKTCIMARDTMSVHYMECPAEGDYHRVGSRCCPSASSAPECLVQCDIALAPGKFYYKTTDSGSHGGKCVRRRHVIPRTVENAVRSRKTGNFVCTKKGYQRIGGNLCQESCPEGYMASKGKCTLPQCTVTPTGDTTTIKCQEGTYGIPSTQI